MNNTCKILILVSLIILVILVGTIVYFCIIKNKDNFNNDEIRYFNKLPYIYLDIFIKNSKLYLICPIYNKKINIDKLKISNNNKQLKLYNNFYSEEVNSVCEIIIYNIENKMNYLFDINYLNYNKLVEVNNNLISKEKKGIAITTLFKWDYKLFDIFYNYYTKQGISHFYMYYNDKLNNHIISFFNRPNVTLIEWNFIHRNHSKNRHQSYNSGYKSIHKHHAQTTQLHDALYKYGKDNYEYMIFCDLDEYINIPNIKIIDYVYRDNNKNIDCFKIDNYFADTLDYKIPDKLPYRIKINDNNINLLKTKCIYKTKNIKLISIHYPIKFEIEKYNILRSKEVKMLHFQNFNSKNFIDHKTNTIFYVK